ncbi:PAS domain-containing sensor histidine kinase [Arenibacter sp. S6351L]|uniref:PAS domain-containing sensor histidine kinase n=1 Tax=Arenibacter sp. S6351L TaxID=2926407 RepID=UPI001FF2BA30|nr:PAS domain-containing sensor histidine kinase [Arenibacter sp. S6351L]MCK0133109.1 PAS domain-containing protein [Arenibacter sp. S6351L]
MNTLTRTITIEEAPIAIATLDTNLCFINCSTPWQQEFISPDKEIYGKSFFDVVPSSPPVFRKILENSFSIDDNIIEEQKHIMPDGSIKWYQWSIKTWKDVDGTIGGLIITCTNITKIKRAKDLLIAAENVAKMGGWDLDMITNTIHWSRITKEIHEVPLDYKPCLKTGINFYKEGEHREKITELIQKAITNGEEWDTELQIVTAKGKELWVRAKGMPEFVNGKCVRLYGIFQDIDKEKKAEIKNTQIKERLDLATEVANIGIWEYNLHKDELEWNDEMFPLFGVKRKDFKGNFGSWKATVHPDDLERCLKEFDMAVSGIKDFKTEFRIVHPDGTIKHIKANAGIFKDDEGKIIKMVGTNWDITEVVNTQLKLNKSEESFKGSFKSSAVGMALVAKDGSWLDVNDTLCLSLGYSRKELLQLSFQDITHPQDLEKDLSQLQMLLDGKVNSYQLEKRYFHKKGTIVYVVLTVTAVKDIEGNISHFISQVVDITAKIEAQKKSEEFLELTKSQNNSLLNFAHIVSHNLRSHSSNLSMLSNYLIEEQGESEKREIEAMIVNASESLNETVAHLNEVVQISTEAEGQLQAVCLNEIVKNVEKNISALLQQKKVECQISIDQSIKVKGIHAYLDSVLLNLFTNSVKYSSPNRIPKISIQATKSGNFIILNFRDNGLGINLERHGKKLFGMYKTFHQHEDSKGIGLFITKNQIEAMNGKIEVESAVDKGTLFKITLVAA